MCVCVCVWRCLADTAACVLEQQYALTLTHSQCIVVVLNSEVKLHHVAFEFLEKHLAVLNCNHYTTRSLFSKVEVSVTCSCTAGK